MKKSMILMAAACLSLSSLAFAQADITGDELPPATSPAHETPHEVELNLTYSHPTLPAEASWPGATVVLILGMFLAAAAVGVVVRMDAPEETPDAHGHDDHGHGHDDHAHGGHGHAPDPHAGGHH